MIIFDLFEDNNNNPQDLAEGVNDGWFTQGSFIAAKKPAGREAFRILKQPEVIKSLEGNLQGKAGDYVITGPNGEEYLNSPEKFLQLKTDNGDGTASPKAIPKQVKLADHDGVLNTSWGDLQYTAGNDYIIRHGTGDYGAVKKDIFPKTYDVIKEEDLDEINRRGFLGLMGAGLGAAALAGLPDVAQAGNLELGGPEHKYYGRLKQAHKDLMDNPAYSKEAESPKYLGPGGSVVFNSRSMFMRTDEVEAIIMLLPLLKKYGVDIQTGAPDSIRASTNSVAKSTSATTPVIEPTTQPNFYTMKAGSNNTTYLIYGTRPDPECTRPIAAIFKGRPVTVMVNPKISSNNEARGYILSSSIREGVDLINMTDLQFYKELLAVLLIPVTALGVSAWNKAMNSLRLYRAEEIVQALQKKGITVDRDTFDQIKPLLQQLEQAIDVNNDGDAAKELAQRIQQTVSWGKLKQPTANRQSPATARDQQGVTEGQYEIHHLDPEGRRKAIYHHGRGYTDDVVRKDTQYHQERNPRDTFRVFKDKQPFDWQGVTEAIREKGALKAAQDAAKFIIRNLDDRNALRNYSAHFWSPEKFYQGATMAMRPGISVDDIVKAIKQDRPAQFEGIAESLEDHERYQYIVTLKSGKRIRFLCSADCDVKTYIERKYKEPVVDIKDQGIVGEPPVELLPGEIKEGSQSFHNGMQVKLTPEYADRPDEVFTVAHCDRERGRCWIGDEQGRGWYASFDQLIPVEDDEDDEGEIKEAIKTIKGPHGRQEVDTDTPGVTRVRQTSRLGAKSFGLPSRPAVATAGVNTPIGKNASSLTNPVSSIRRTRPRLDRDDSGQLASYSSEETIKELAPTQKQPSEQEGKINAELRKLRAQYPDARSDLEAVAIGGQEAHADARQHLARVDAIVSKLDRAADQLQSVNTDQDSELNVLDRENNDLEQKVKDLEKRIGQLKGSRSKDQPTQAQSTEPRDEPAAKAEPAKAKDKPNPEPAKTSNIDPDELPPARKAELKQKATQVLQDPEKFGKDTAAPMARDISARLRKSSSARDNISPDEMAMIQKMVADASKYKEPYRPSAKEVAKAAEKTKTQADLFRQHNDMTQGEPVNEVSPEYIERYKKEHGRRATAADQAGDYAKGHEHFKKINQLTKQQFQRGAKTEKVDEISNFMTQPTEPVSPEEQWKRRIRLLAKQYQTNASSLAALARENGPDSAEAVAYEYLRDPSKIRVPGATAPASAVNWDEVIRRLPMGLSGMALLQAAEEYLINNRGMLRSTVRSLLNNDENQRTLSAAYAKKNTTSESVTEESDNEAVEQAIIRRIMVGRTDLLLKHGPKKVMQAVEEVADYVGAVDEIGSSDVSGWIRQVERVLG